MTAQSSGLLTSVELVRTGATVTDKADAIAQAAQLLIAAGCIDADYEQSMLRREEVADTFLGYGVAIPHGLVEDRLRVRRNGIAVLQIPDGLSWNDGQQVYLVVAIAAQSDAHIDVLRRLTRLIQNDAQMSALRSTQVPQDIVTALLEDAQEPLAEQPATDLEEAAPWKITYPAGLHARPAKRWVETARSHSGAVRVRQGDRSADAKNLVALLELGLSQGDELVVSASGTGARDALQKLLRTMNSLTAAEQAAARKQAQPPRRPKNCWQSADAEAAVIGIGASPGLAIGTLWQLQQDAVEIFDEPIELAEGGERLHVALETTRAQLRSLTDATRRKLGADDAAIFEAQSELLGDTDLITLACQHLVAGHGVAWSWHQAVEHTAARLEKSGNPVMAGRAADLRDAGQRVLGNIDPVLRREGLKDVPQNAIVLAHDLAPSDTANLDTDKVAGLATCVGGPTSHTAILARTLGLPALVAGGDLLATFDNGTPAIIDGLSGALYLNPTQVDLDSANRWILAEEQRRQQEASERQQPARTLDGVEIDIAANINLPDQVPGALDLGAEGVGLMRTEFLFLERGSTPSEDEQYETYTNMAKALEGRELIVRALDIGGDKQVAHLELPHEENPFLGVRGARLLLRRPDLLEPQLRALYRSARDGAKLSIMFPMITSVAELQELRKIAEGIRRELQAPAVPLGIMIEVPAAAVQADLLALHADFFSIGTNDLTQYVLAMDRQNPDLAPEADSLHPAVLRMIKHTIDGARKHKRWVGVCGGLAGDPFGASLLAGLGVQELSMTPRDIPAVKAQLRKSQFADLQALAERALACESADEVKALEPVEKEVAA